MIETSATHQTPQAKNKSYQHLLIKPVFSLLANHLPVLINWFGLKGLIPVCVYNLDLTLDFVLKSRWLVIQVSITFFVKGKRQRVPCGFRAQIICCTDGK